MDEPEEVIPIEARQALAEHRLREARQAVAKTHRLAARARRVTAQVRAANESNHFVEMIESLFQKESSTS